MKYIPNSILILILVIALVSCTKTKTSKVEGKPNIEIETPKVLLQNESRPSDILSSGLSYSKFNSYQDVVNELFEEACKSNGELNKLQQSIYSEITNSRENTFAKKLKPYQNEVKKITYGIERLENSLEELKIKVALKMMKGFQNNEVPELEVLAKMNSVLKDLNDKTEILIDNIN